MNRLFLCALLLTSSLSAYALQTDANKNIRVESDSFNMQYRQGVAVYKGNVIADQGSRHLTSDILTIYRNKAGKINRLTAKGKPAHFKTRPQAGGSPVIGHANTIIYKPLIHQVTLIDNAYLTQDGNKFNGPILYYNTETKVVTSPNSPKGRSVMYITPTKNEKHHDK